MIAWVMSLFSDSYTKYDLTTNGGGCPLPVLLKRLKDEGLLKMEVR